MRRSALGVFLLLALLAPLQLRSSVPHSAPRIVPPFLDAKEHGMAGEGIREAPSRCRSMPNQIYRTGNTDVISSDSIVAIGSNKGCYTPQNEPTMAVNPVDPDWIVVGANDYRVCCDSDGHNDGTGWVYVSADGGVTWQNILVPGLTRETGGQGMFARADSAGDPSLAFSPDGKTLYYSNLVINRADLSFSAMVVSVSHDGGLTWGKPHAIIHNHDVHIFNDKEWLAVGPQGQLALTWTRFHETGGLFVVAEIWLAKSKDGGMHWSKARRITDNQHELNQGSQPVFAPDGTLYVLFESAPYLGPTDMLSVVRVTPHGIYSQDLADVYDGRNCYPQNSDNRNTLSDMQIRVSSLPSAAVDPSTGTVAVVWADDETSCSLGDSNFAGATSAQVKLVYLHGSHHSPPRTITSGNDKAFPAVAYQNGVTLVGFYSRDWNLAGPGLDYAYASSEDGFQEHRLSDGSSDPNMQFSGLFQGDYTAVALGNTLGYAAWTDSRGALGTAPNQDVYFSRFSVIRVVPGRANVNASQTRTARAG